jgi:hypothetical protein
MGSEKRGRSSRPRRGEERRKHRRFDTNESGTLVHDGLSYPCVVLNVSSGGALVVAAVSLSDGAEVDVEMAKLGRNTATVVRTPNSHIGVRFINELVGDPRGEEATEPPSG